MQCIASISVGDNFRLLNGRFLKELEEETGSVLHGDRSSKEIKIVGRTPALLSSTVATIKHLVDSRGDGAEHRQDERSQHRESVSYF